jgi:Ni/Co efflux regulator RcnB
MKNLAFAGVAAIALMAFAPAAQASDSFAPGAETAPSTLAGGVFEGRKGVGKIMGGGHGPRPMPGIGGHGPRPMPMVGGHHGPRPNVGGHHGPRPNMGHHRWGNRVNGRWSAGHYAPGGWGGYRTPFRGYILPSYWINPGYSISNYGLYGLSTPAAGWGWSRYYDDAVLRDGRGYVQDYRPNVAWDRYEGGYAPDGYAPSGGYYAQPQYAPAIGAERVVYENEGAPAYSADDNSRYSYEGDWTQGRYVDPQERVFEGQWNGTVTRDGYAGAAGAPYPASPGYGAAPAPRYATPGGYERYESCLRSNGVAGGAIGAIIGGVAGNRIAGRGNRTIGTILGGAAGGIAGASIEKATKKCDKYLPREDYAEAQYPAPAPYPRPAPAPSYPAPSYPQQTYPTQQGGYYHGGYYYPAPVITTVTIASAPVTTTTTTVTEEVYYETVAVKRKPAVRKWKPRAKPKPRCHCH